MKVYDITRSLDATIPFFKGDPPFETEAVRTLAKDGCRQTLLKVHTHAGTHMDAPSHVMEEGAGVRALPVEKFIGPCRVCITLEEAQKAIAKGIRKLVFKTGYKEVFNEVDFRELKLEALDLIGVETLAVGTVEMHIELFNHGVMIVEELDLKGVKPGDYFLSALPLKLDLDGSPIRTVLVEM